MAAASSQLDQLRAVTEIVADTGEIEQIKKFHPQDATTNPSLLYKAALNPEYEDLVKQSIQISQERCGKTDMGDIMDQLAVTFGAEILNNIDGYVSTELDARLSYNTEACVEKALKLIGLYEEAGINARERVLFKIASTYEGIQAMKILEAQGIKCNMTLLFSIWQAAAAAEGGAYLISPFVGRITDFHKAKNGWTELPAVEEDPGVLSVRNIYNYYKTYGYKTIVMGASFRSKEQVLALAGADKLTIAPKLLKAMEESNDAITVELDAASASFDGPKLEISEPTFRWGMASDPCAREKLANGIVRFANDTEKLENVIRDNYLEFQLDQLRTMTQIVADTGEIEEIKKFRPQDATTNPSLLYKAALKPEYESLVKQAIETSQQRTDGTDIVDIMDQLAVNFGVEILNNIDGLVSTELDARLSYDTEACVAKALKLIDLYEQAGVNAQERVLFKIASTWEGIQAMKILEAQGIHCNMTLLFSIWQAAGAADGGAYLISPFVGRITDFYKAKNGWTELPPVEEDPGVLSVRNIFNYYKQFGYDTIVMGASFRSKEQVLALAGADKLTIGPKWLKAMEECADGVVKHLDASTASYDGEQLEITEATFRWGMASDACATEKLADGIRRFAADTEKLETVLNENYLQ